jgi:hypothetical protein
MKSTNHITVPLNPTDAEKEMYRARDENFIQVSFQSWDGSVSKDQDSRVILTMNKDGMFALGSALVRASCSTESSKGCWELKPASKEEAIECLGVYLHPKSCQLVINLDSMGTLEDAFSSPE